MPAASRREARERALSLLYEAEQKGEAPSAVLADQPLAPDPFVAELVQGVEATAAEADALITTFARGWKLERMPVLDRAILRMAIFELAHLPSVPTATVIDEAVELAKRYSTEESGRFVNGVLASVARQVR